MDERQIEVSWRARWMGRASSLPVAHQIHEARLDLRIIAENSEKLRRHRLRTDLGNTAPGHAGMLGPQHHCDAPRLEHLLDRGGNLRVEMLLGLQPQRKDVDQ